MCGRLCGLLHNWPYRTPRHVAMIPHPCSSEGLWRWLSAAHDTSGRRCGLHEYWLLGTNVSKIRIIPQSFELRQMHQNSRVKCTALWYEVRSAECTDVSEWPLSASDLTMHATSCLNPIMTWIDSFWYIAKRKSASEFPKRAATNHAL